MMNDYTRFCTPPSSNRPRNTVVWGTVLLIALSGCSTKVQLVQRPKENWPVVSKTAFVNRMPVAILKPVVARQKKQHYVSKAEREVKIQKPLLTEGIQVRKRDVDCLAKNIYFEARFEPVKGQIAVGLVTINRAKSDTGMWPDTICGVVYQRRQFSWYNDGRSDIPKNRDMYGEIRDLARDLLYTHLFTDFLNGADHYHAVYVRRWWTRHMTRVTTIGRHIFYRSS